MDNSSFEELGLAVSLDSLENATQNSLERLTQNSASFRFESDSENSNQHSFYQPNDFSISQNIIPMVSDASLPSSLSEAVDFNPQNSEHNVQFNQFNVATNLPETSSADLMTDQEFLFPQQEKIKEKAKKDGKSRKEIEEEEREKMQVLVSNFTEDQLDRYEMFRRSAFPKAAIKRIMQTLSGTTVGQNVVIAMAGISKVFVGEVVEEALQVMESYGESGPLQPKHLREAVRRIRMKKQVQIPTMKQRRPTFMH